MLRARYVQAKHGLLNVVDDMDCPKVDFFSCLEREFTRALGSYQFGQEQWHVIFSCM